MTTSGYADLTRDQLARLVPELLLIGQLVGIAGIAAERIHHALGTDTLRTLELHPLLNPAANVEANVEDGTPWQSPTVLPMRTGAGSRWV